MPAMHTPDNPALDLKRVLEALLADQHLTLIHI